MNKIAASPEKLANCILLHTYSLQLRFSAVQAQTKTSHSLFNKLT